MVLASELPDAREFEVCASLRAQGHSGGIILLAAHETELDRVAGLDAGADDYVVQHVTSAELHARIRAVMRRLDRAASTGTGVSPWGLRLDGARRRIQSDGYETPLSPLEFEVLGVLLRHRGDVVPRSVLVKQVWRRDPTCSTKNLDMVIGRLRRKMKDARVPEQITNERGVGFRLR
ncbi:response regulator transcription factor [Nocardioides potassii]|uniref:response regulator transcription factor n=1 Tax=Nocardioides potassii TaxID=2911371 RepID=UPI0035586F27